MIVPAISVFLDLPPELTDRESSRAVVVPVPFEGSTCYGKGTIYGPHAIIEASHQVELWDEQLRCEPCDMGICTEAPFVLNEDWEKNCASLAAKAQNLVKEKKFPLFLGGEHSLSGPIVKGIARQYPKLSVLHCDAHADLREEYLGLKWSHASVMKRIFEMNIPFTSVGIRSLSKEEHELITENNLNVFYAHERESQPDWIEQAIASLTDTVYLTFDIDAVDVSEVRSTGTPEPGGLYWREVIALLTALRKSGKKVVGADLVELAPRDSDVASTFYAARLAYKILAYLA